MSYTRSPSPLSDGVAEHAGVDLTTDGSGSCQDADEMATLVDFSHRGTDEMATLASLSRQDTEDSATDGSNSCQDTDEMATLASLSLQDTQEMTTTPAPSHQDTAKELQSVISNAELDTSTKNHMNHLVQTMQTQHQTICPACLEPDTHSTASSSDPESTSRKRKHSQTTPSTPESGTTTTTRPKKKSRKHPQNTVFSTAYVGRFRRCNNDDWFSRFAVGNPEPVHLPAYGAAISKRAGNTHQGEYLDDLAEQHAEAGMHGQPRPLTIFGSTLAPKPSLPKHKHPEDVAAMVNYLTNPDPHLISKTPTEEAIHSWSTMPTDYPKIMVRLWDHNSKAHIEDGKQGFLSQCGGVPLDTPSLRTYFLQSHVDFRSRAATPFISVTSDPSNAANFHVRRLKARQEKRSRVPVVRFTLMNWAARVAEGMPTLHMGRELRHYNVYNPYAYSACSDAIEKFEWLALWCVPPSQIVGTWFVGDMEDWMARRDEGMSGSMRPDARWLWSFHFDAWWKLVALPAYEAHERTRLGGGVPEHIENCGCCGHS
ncbi:hypothetical protein EJ05DRAFT_499924 [Pseudovirgaria hyperparasitica]|uniref:DUF7587 domain-containing protein n=1 Tax=Pseudovirgaria hyperparasitica TaxID=470096 RepID=A0A6A6W8Z5_9PEZI|nr:uncharacterized protein EJ05DRAFT_499924 [Pseudovirgaria hyperparasitica]KAF2758400.1 hypothetical protein EJ05DRAFT_499924 [Pseudovirgaria hyperparasitica]